MKKMISVEEAQETVLEHTPPLPPTFVAIEESAELALAEDVCADRDYPPFNRAMMDGFAVRLSDRGKRVKIASEVAAGDSPSLAVSEGACAEIMTGAPCPSGTEAVVKKEDVKRDGNEVVLPQKIERNENISAKGADCKMGALVLRKGNIVSPLTIANLAAFGVKEVAVYPNPSLAIITTGGELVEKNGVVSELQIRNSNSPMLITAANLAGITRIETLHCADNLVALSEAIETASKNDIVVLTGGVSEGKYDLVPQALSKLGAELIFHKVKQKPGKPLLFAKKGRTLFFGLPGNPLASLFSFYKYVLLACRKMSSKPVEVAYFWGKLKSPARLTSDRTFFLLCRAEKSREGWLLEPMVNQGSADIFTPARANSFVTLPAGESSLPHGEPVMFEFFGSLRWLA
ncbi:MAG: molybdopterin molybdotransferase MoeA [Myxococcota bacterium]